MGGCFSGPDTHGKGLCASPCVSGVFRGNPLLKEQLRDLCDCSVLTKGFCSKGEVKIVLDLWDSKVGVFVNNRNSRDAWWSHCLTDTGQTRLCP